MKLTEDGAAGVNFILREHARGLGELEFLEAEIEAWRDCRARRDMIDGERYYGGGHDILRRRRTVIGPGGALHEVSNLPNNRIVDNQYAGLVDQKVNYLLGSPFTIDTRCPEYAEALHGIFGPDFMRRLRCVCEDSLNGGIGWLHPYIDAGGALRFRRFESYEIMPLWRDAEHTVLDGAARLYHVERYDGSERGLAEFAEVYGAAGVARYEYTDGRLLPYVPDPGGPYIGQERGGEVRYFGWERVPLVAFKYNAKETPLITRVRALQDGINEMESDFQNNMQQDARNTILVLHNYDGEDLGEFRHNLALYGAVKVRSVDGAAGGVSTLEVSVNAENYKAILQLFKKALIENGRGFDAKDDRLLSSPNQMNIRSMYSAMDLDATGMESEYQASFEQLLWFARAHLLNTGVGDFTGEDARIVFNRNMLINEGEVIDGCVKSAGLISRRTLLSAHPWVEDIEAEENELGAPVRAQRSGPDGEDI